MKDTATTLSTTGGVDDNNGQDGGDQEENPIDDAIRPILEDSGGDSRDVEKLCQRFSQILDKASQIGREQNKDLQNGGKSTTASSGPAKLAAPVSMRAQQAQIDKAVRLAQTRPTDLAHAKGRTVASQVDTEKLRKAEARIAAKLEKRVMKSNYEASKLIDQSTVDDEELLLKVNPVLDYTSTRGKSKDIHVEDFDIAFAGNRILTGASLHMVHGRRYGLIGRNGIGKSTLLRNLSHRELAIPTYISILHVEQEMHGRPNISYQSGPKSRYIP